jgi:hypothetical protein
MPTEKCLIVILGNEIDFQMVEEVPLKGIKIKDEFFNPIEFGAEDYFFDWLIDENGNVIGVGFYNKDILGALGSFSKYNNLEFDKNLEWTNIYFSHKTEYDPEKSIAQQNLNTLLLKGDKNRHALTFPVYDYDLTPKSKQSLDERFHNKK